MDPGGFLADILDEPETLARVLDAYEERPAEPLTARRVLFLGMGSSRFAALAAASRLRAAGVDALRGVLLGRSRCRHLRPTSPLSRSRRAERPRRRSRPRRVTAASLPRDRRDERSGRPAGGDGGHRPAALAGEEQGGIACKTYQATVAVLLALTGVPGGHAPAGGRGRPITSSRAASTGFGRALEVLGGGPIDVVAPAERLASAEQSALMLREAPRIRAVACETGDWLARGRLPEPPARLPGDPAARAPASTRSSSSGSSSAAARSSRSASPCTRRGGARRLPGRGRSAGRAPRRDDRDGAARRRALAPLAGVRDVGAGRSRPPNASC